MRNKIRFCGIIALVMAIGFSFVALSLTGCSGGGPGPGPGPGPDPDPSGGSGGNTNNNTIVTFNSVTADGSAWQTTTELTLTFSQAITGLSAANITLSGVSDVSKGTLSGSGSTYILPISGFTVGGTLNVMVAKSGYTINETPKAVIIYHYNSSDTEVTLNSVTVDGSDTQTTTELTLTFSQAINGLSANDISLSGISDVTKGKLSGSGPTYILPISGFTVGGTLNVMVTKSGYTINETPKTVIIYHYNSSDTEVTLNSVTADGSDTQTTTELTLTFSQAINGLSANDISLSGISDVTKGKLSGSGPTYILPISGFTVGGTLNVMVAKSGYTINETPKAVIIYYYNSSDTEVTLNSVTVDGSDTQTTTELTLTFSQAINGLSANDISLSGISDVTKGKLSGSGPTYILPISGFTVGGTLSVMVTKSGYTINETPKAVIIYHYNSSDTEVTLNSVTVDGSDTQTTTQLTLTFSQAINGLNASDITLSDVSGVTKGTLSGSGPAYTLPISGFTMGGTLSVMVAKSGYTINETPKTVTIYYYNSSDTEVTFNSVTADGSDTQTTTQLTLTFSKAITGLSASDITLSGVSGITKGTLSGSGPAYTLPISGFTVGGTLNVMVAKPGYTINETPKTVIIYYYNSSDTEVTLNSVTADGSASQTTTELTLTFSQAITGFSASDITLSDVSGVTKGTLSGSGPAYTLPISGFTVGGTLNVTVAKSGYTINETPKTVTIYYYNSSGGSASVGIVIDLTDMNEWELTEQTAQAAPLVNKIFTVTGTYTAYRWYLDGVSVGTSSSYTFNKPVGVYQLVVVVTDSAGESRSGRCWITVTASAASTPDGSEANPYPLTINTWLDGNITSTTNAVWYSFDVTYGTTYRVWWNDSYRGNGTKSLDVMVGAAYSDGTSIFYYEDSGWDTAQLFTANQTGTVKVVAWTSGNTGTFAVAYSTSSTRP